MIYDQTIIGCGLAGLTELKKTLQEKKNVCVVAEGFGATQHMSGVLDFPEAQAFCEFYGVPVVSGAELCVIGPIGQIRPIGRDAAALKTQAFTAAETQQIKKVLFVEITSLADFPSALVVPNLQKTFSDVVSVRFAEISLNITSPHAHLLQLFDNGSCVEIFKKFLLQHKGEANLIVIPPVLGLKNFAVLHEQLEKDIGVRIVEQLSTTPPVAGLRFTRIIKKFFTEKNVNVVWGRVVGFDKDGVQVKSVVVESSSTSCRPYSVVRIPPDDGRLTTDDRMLKSTVSSQEFILATGKFLGGGLRFEDGVRETIFDLPCSVGQGVVSKNVPITKLIQRDPLQEQAFLKLGVVVNDEGLVIDPVSGNPIYKNLKAAGSVRGRKLIS